MAKGKLIALSAVVLIAVVIIAVMIVSRLRLPPPPSGYEWYSNTEHGFRIGYPKSWNKSYPASSTLLIEFIAPDRSAVFNIGFEPVGNMTLGEYVAAAKVYLENKIIIDERHIEVNGRKGYELILLAEGGIKYNMHDIFIVKQNAYIITFGTFAQDYDVYTDTFYTILNSFYIE